MANLTDSDLRDPSPPVPGAKERAAVAARAHQLGRRRRILQGAGALGMVVAVAVGVAALTAGGTSSSPGGRRIAAAGSAADDSPSSDVATTTTPAPAVSTVPAPAPESSVATGGTSGVATDVPVTEPTTPTVAAPSTFTVSGTVSNVPAGVIVTLTLRGPGGTFTAIADGSGHYSISGVPAGEYEGLYSAENTDGTFSRVGKVSGVSVTGDLDVSFSMQ